MEVARLGVRLELQLPAYTTATATGSKFYTPPNKELGCYFAVTLTSASCITIGLLHIRSCAQALIAGEAARITVLGDLTQLHIMETCHLVSGRAQECIVSVSIWSGSQEWIPHKEQQVLVGEKSMETRNLGHTVDSHPAEHPGSI